jgi:hypothetical protein
VPLCRATCVGVTARPPWRRWLTAAGMAVAGPCPIAPHALARQARLCKIRVWPMWATQWVPPCRASRFGTTGPNIFGRPGPPSFFFSSPSLRCLPRPSIV